MNEVVARGERASSALAWYGRLLAAVALCLATNCSSEAGDQVVLRPAQGEPVKVAVELATTPSTRRMGLMYRSELGPKKGMLFVFPQKGPQAFWMRNTKIPLDILYLADDGRIVNFYANTTPFSEKSLPSEEPVRFVLEVEGGFCEKHGIRPGDTVELGKLARLQGR